MSRESEKNSVCCRCLFPDPRILRQALRIVLPSRQGNYRIKNRASLSFLRFSARESALFLSHPAGLNLTDGMHAEPRCREDGELLLFPLFPQVLSHSSDSFLHRLNRAAFIASAAVQTMILRNPIRTARFDTALRTVIRTFSAADTAVRYFISFRSDFCVPDGILLPENRMYPR